MSGFFKWAVTYTLKNEGGFVDDPDDSGRATNFGITTATLAYRRGRPVTVDDVRNLTVEEAISIYETNFWMPTGLELVKQPGVAISVFDAGVLFGVGVAMLSAQKALVDCGFGLVIDGCAGPRTTDAMSAVKRVAFVTAFIAELSERIEFIILHHPKDSKYRKSWLARVNRYLLLT